MPDAAQELATATADIQLTRSAREVLDGAVAIATARGASQADPVDVLRALLESRGTLAAQSIRELGGDPASIAFFHHVGLAYVSCSPFRVIIARLAAAQVAVNKSAHVGTA